jgi:predicted alpha-1,2-mannosidase
MPPLSRPSPLRIAAAALVAVLLTACSGPGSASPGTSTTDVAALVNPFIGTAGAVDAFPGADLPFGMIQWSPDTPSRPFGGGYSYNDNSITGFSLTHLSGPGCAAYGDIPFLPTVGPIPASPSDAIQPFSHEGEQASPGSYAVTLGSHRDLNVALTVTTRAGLGRFTYPAGSASNMLIKLGSSAARDRAAAAQVVGHDRVAGSATSGEFCGNHDRYTVYFAAQFSQPFTSHGTWNGTDSHSGARGLDAPTEAGASQSGLWLTFDTTKKRTVLVRVAVSFVSAASALQNLAAEVHGWDFGGAQKAARAAWNDMLGRIRVAGGSTTDRTVFYTALYHSLLHPNVFSDVDGQYMGFDGRVHSVQAGHAQYANYSGWDIYRSQVQLLALLAPSQGSDMAQSMVNDYQESGMLPKWSLANGESFVMVGDPAAPILAGLYAFGARDFDTRGALAAMVHEATQPNQIRPGLRYWQALGYLPSDGAYGCCNFYGPVSTSLEYATADFAISRLATALGDSANASTFAKRSAAWRNLFNGTSGFMQPKLASGEFAPGFIPTSGTDFVEGDAYQYTPMVPFDVQGLITAMGGPGPFTTRLDNFFTQLNTGEHAPYAWMGNEPGLEIPWQYDYAHAPWKTQAVVRRIDRELWTNTPAGEPGNDDLGEMASWYVWSALGMYPETPGSAYLALGSPLFPDVTVTLGSGKSLRISAPAAGPSRPYVRSLRLDGQDWPRSYLPPSVIEQGASLKYSLGGAPDQDWAAGPLAAPPSWPGA